MMTNIDFSAEREKDNTIADLFSKANIGFGTVIPFNIDCDRYMNVKTKAVTNKMSMTRHNASREHFLHGCDGEVKGLAAYVPAYTYGIFLILQLVLSVFGNILVCLAIIRFHHLRTLTNSFIFSLAVTDLLTPFARVLSIAIAMFRQQWVFGCVWCQLSSVLGVFLCASSIMHLCAISIERFIVIRWPLRQHHFLTKKRVTVGLVNIWITALVLSLFPYFGIVHLAFNAELLDCEISWNKNPEMAVLLTCFFFLLPLLLITVTYYYIFQEVKVQTKKISSLQITQSPDNGKERKVTISSKLRIGRILRQELKAVKIIVVVIGLFFGLWSPLFVVTSIRAYAPDTVSGDVQRFAFALAYLNSGCNWIVYSIMNKEFRAVFKRMLFPVYSCFSKRTRHSTAQVGYDLPDACARSAVSVKSKPSTSGSLAQIRAQAPANNINNNFLAATPKHVPVKVAEKDRQGSAAKKDRQGSTAEEDRQDSSAEEYFQGSTLEHRDQLEVTKSQT